MISTSAATPYRVNLGCGARFVPSWVNIDMISTGDSVIAHDLSKGIPLPDKSAEIVYHSHVLEHIPREGAVSFLRECFRVLQPGGTIRIAVPDLERICRTYLEKLELAVSGDAAAAHDYEWIMLELYDQAVRNKPGGGMLDYIAAATLNNPDFILERIGEEGEGLIGAIRGSATGSPAAKRRPLAARMRNVPVRLANLYRRIVIRVLLGRRASKIFATGSMRVSGEVHQWMYDRYSLSAILQKAGFRDTVVRRADESRVGNWSALELDTNSAGEPVKPDSLYMEAIRPESS